MIAIKTVHNEEKKRIDLYNETGDHMGEIEYMKGGNNELFATHTEVFEGNEGKGYGTVLVDELVRFAEDKNAKIVPICPFVKAAFMRKPEKYGKVAKL